MAQNPFSQDAWARARDRFVEDLSEKEKAIYYQASLEMIFYDASALQKQHQAGSRSLEIVKRLQPLGNAIEQYGQALDVYANAYPLALSPLWGSIRIVLHLASEFGKYFEKVVDMLERIGDVLPLFRSYEMLFPNHERLTQRLSIVYVDILKFCDQIKSAFRQGRKSYVANLKIFSRLIWKPFDDQFGKVLSDFRQHKDNVEKEVQLAHMIESADFNAVVLANTKQIMRQKAENERREFLSRLTPIDHNLMLQKFEKLRCHGTCSWVFQENSYVEWTSLNGRQKLCILGIPGSGKSILTSAIIRNLQSDGKNVIFYHASYLDARSLELHNILGSLLKQVLDAGLVPEEQVRELIQKCARNGYVLGEDDKTDTLKAVIQHNANTFWVIDGLEECQENDQRRMLETISLLSANPFHILLTCREEGQLWRFLKEWSSIKLNEHFLSSDIEAFTKSSVIREVTAGSMIVGDNDQQKFVIEELVHRSRGMFLWVHFQVKELCLASSPKMLSDILGNLPEGLNETYERILARISEKTIHKNLAKRTFMWLACSRRPLRIEELQEAVAFDLDDESYDENKIARRESILQACHGLVIMQDHVPCFAHYTIQQFLLQDTDPEHSTLRSLNPLTFSKSQAEELAAETCVAYLNFSDFETAITRKPPEVQLAPTGILGPGGPGTIPSVLGLGNPVFDIAYRLMGRKSRATPLGIDYSQYLRIQPQVSKQWADLKYALRAYAAEHWIWHTKRIHDETRFYKKFCLLVTSKRLMFDFRPWGANRHFGPYGCRACSISGVSSAIVSDLPWTAALHWAAEHGHTVVLRPIFGTDRGILISQREKSKYFDHERYSNESSFLACHHGQLEIIKWLLQEGYQVESYAAHYRAAILAKQPEVIKYLMTLTDIDEENFSLLLKEIVHSEHPSKLTDLVFVIDISADLLLHHDWLFNSITVAIKQGSWTSVRSLLTVLSPRAFDSQQIAKLWRAAVESGQVLPVYDLQNLSFSVREDPQNSESLLEMAIRMERYKILRCLLDLQVVFVTFQTFDYSIMIGGDSLYILLEYEFGQAWCDENFTCIDAIRTRNLNMINQLLQQKLSWTNLSVERPAITIKVVELLIQNGADLNQIMINQANRTAIFLLVDISQKTDRDSTCQLRKSLLELLGEIGAELKHMDENSDTIYEVALGVDGENLSAKLLEIESRHEDRPWLWKLYDHATSHPCLGDHSFNTDDPRSFNKHDWKYLLHLKQQLMQEEYLHPCISHVLDQLEMPKRPEMIRRVAFKI